MRPVRKTLMTSSMSRQIDPLRRLSESCVYVWCECPIDAYQEIHRSRGRRRTEDIQRSGTACHPGGECEISQIGCVIVVMVSNEDGTYTVQLKSRPYELLARARTTVDQNVVLTDL